MKSNYEALGKHIRLVDYRNSEEVTSTVLGISIDKEFMPSVANVIGTDLSRYKLISKGLFACNPMHVGRDERLPIALYENEEPAICALPGFVDSKNEEKTERNAGYLVVSHSGGGMLRQGTRKGIRRTPANRGMRAHRIVKSLDISEDVCHGLCP